VDPLLALDRIQSLDTFLRDAIAPQRFRTTLMLGLAGVGLLLATIGIAGVTARAIAERTLEFGVRLTLGADRAQLWRRVVADEMRIAAVGIAAGLVLAAAVGRLLSSLLPDAQGFDPTVGALAALLLASSTALAAAIPATRVLRLDPMTILRDSTC
jgi:ABC-type antimicrobial peptide transport system permease subunit